MLGFMRRSLLLAAAALVLLVVVVARGESSVPTNLPGASWPDPAQGARAVLMPSIDTGNSEMTADGSLLFTVVGALVALLVAVAIVRAVRLASRRRRLVRTSSPEQGVSDGQGHTTAVAFERAVTRARDLLARPESVPGDAVIAAWLALEHATKGRRPHETATEFAAALPADEHALAELRALYQRARFSTVPVTEDDVARARAALDRVLVTLR